jgi:hypothetical protein
MIPDNADDYRLFWIDPTGKQQCPRVFFTTGDITKEWGDDWNDAPWEHNAGSPYCNQKSADYFVMRIENGDLTSIRTPDEYGHGGNSPYSVEMINKGFCPWLVVDIWKPDLREYEEHANLFPAGTTLKDFIVRAKNCDITMWFLTEPYFKPKAG